MLPRTHGQLALVKDTDTTRPSGTQRLLAWGAHAFTASGALVGVVALLEIAAGELEHAALWMLVALSIDSVDGFLARAADVSRVLPAVDGRRLDDLVDFLNYAIVPAVFLLAIGAFVWPILAAVPILASSYGFSQRDAKTPDSFFLGWPSYWNVVALSVWLLELSSASATAVVLVLAILVFVPLKYVHPSRMPALRLATNLGAFAWILLMAYACLDPARARALRVPELSLLYPAYYFAVSARQGGWLRGGV
jgi:phosphatidylcholine synthase